MAGKIGGSGRASGGKGGKGGAGKSGAGRTGAARGGAPKGGAGRASGGKGAAGKGAVSRGAAGKGTPRVSGAGAKANPKASAKRGAPKKAGSYVRGASTGDGGFKKGKVVGDGSRRGAGPRATSANTSKRTPARAVPREDVEWTRGERVERELGGEQIEGRQALREVLRAGNRRVKEIFLAEDLEPSAILDEIINLGQKANVPVRELSRGRLDKITRTETHQGVMAYVSPLHEYSVADLLAIAAKSNTAPFIVCMDSVTDPHNLGNTLRTALCAGATGVVLPRNRGALVTATTAKAAAGAIEYLPIAVVPGIPSALAELAKAKVWTVGLDGEATVGLYDKEFAQLTTDPIALVLGAEGRGLSELAAKRCDMLVNIPQTSHIDSLNVSAAGAIAMFEVARLRR